MDNNNNIFDGPTITDLLDNIIKQKFATKDSIEYEGKEYDKESFRIYLLHNIQDDLRKFLITDLCSDIKDQKEYYDASMSARKKTINSKLKKTLSLLKAVILKSSEVGVAVHSTIDIKRLENTATIPKSEMVKFVLLKIHSRAMEVSGEILSLLEYGFVLGGMARWRSLFEYTVIAQALIDLDDFEMAVMYLKHDIVSFHKSAEDLFLYANHKVSDFDDIHENFQKLVDEYGKDYTKNFGWYKPCQKIDFISLAKKHKMETLLGYFRESNMPNHGSSFRIFEGNQDIKEKINSYEIPVQNLVLSIGTLSQSILQYFMRTNREPSVGYVTLMNFFSTAVEQVTRSFFEERKKVDKTKPSYQAPPKDI